MAKVTLICGKVCSGKTRLARTLPGVPLSCDELMTSLFPEPMGERYDDAARRSKEYLLSLAETLLRGGVDVLLDWGFWTRAERDETRARFERVGAEVELVYVEPTPERRAKNIEARNAEAAAGAESVYAADEGLLRKGDSRFEPPAPPERFTLVRNE